MQQGKGVRIRLAEVDCPEKRQPYGQAAKRFTSSLCFYQVVKVEPVTTDRYSRVVAHVILPDGSNLSEELVRAGMAWQFRRYSRSKRLAEIEAEARRAKRGLWAEPNPVPPWVWKQKRRRGGR